MKNIIKSFFPPITVLLLRFIRRKIKIFLGDKPVYGKKVYNHKNNIKEIIGTPYESKNWTKGVENELINNFKIDPNIHQKSLLNSIKILDKIGSFSKINIIDYGGGCGVLITLIDKIKKNLNT